MLTNMNEGLWRKAEANQVMRERRRLLKNGTISPRSTPNILVKTENLWKFPPISVK